ncbi:MAG TPA: ATP-binding protein, partial [Polyangiaceae bacterium]
MKFASDPFEPAQRPRGRKSKLAIDATALERDVRELDAKRAIVERMASLGALTAGVAHEINNPLAYVLGSLDIGLRELADLKALIRADASEEQTLVLGALSALDNARHGAERMRHIVRDLMDLSRTSAHAESADVEAVLDLTVRVAWNEIRHRARLVKAYSGISRVSGDEARLGQIFLNLIVNAAQAIEGDPMTNEIRLSTANVGGSAVIEVTDTGVGIPRTELPRIFDPFYTTKPAGVGTGLGLAICHDLVAELGGEISVSSGEK